MARRAPEEMARLYPQYEFERHKGYPTKAHRAAIRQYGPSPYHRRTFNLLGDAQLSLDL